MKTVKLLISLAICFLTTNVSANESEQFETIQQQISELNSLIEDVGRDRVGYTYFQRISESKAKLAQIKAEPTLQKYNSEEINSLYYQLDNILHPENKQGNNNKLLHFLNKTNNPNGIISGVVTSGKTGEGLIVDVKLFNIHGNFVTQTITDSNGRYFFRELIMGQYYIVANKRSGDFSLSNYLTTSYPAIICEMGLGRGCQLEDLIPINLAENQLISNIDVEMAFEPIISGKIVDSNDSTIAIEFAQIKLFNLNGELVSEVSSSSSSGMLGEYLISAPPGDYYMTVGHSNYNTQLYENITCNNSCDLNMGTRISMAFNQPIEDFDLALVEGSSMSGSLVDKVSKTPISEGKVYFYNIQDQIVGSANINQLGLWNEPNLPLGDYKIVSTSNDYLATLHNGIGCYTYYFNDCQLTSGLVVLHNTEATENIVLQQVKGTTISGRVFNNSNQPLSQVRLKLYNSDFELIKDYIYSNGVTTDVDGFFELSPIGIGDYYILADSYISYQDELFPNIPCTKGFCDLSQGTQIQISSLNPVGDINFYLNEISGSISGKITDVNNNPIQSAIIYARLVYKGANSNSLGDFQSYSDQFGNYQFDNLPIGTYQVYSSKSRNDPLQNYLPQIYLDTPCLYNNCYDVNFMPVVVNNTQVRDINFNLSRKGIVNFNLISSSSNPITIYDGRIRVLNSNGNGVYLGSSSNYRTVYLNEGDYYFVYNAGNFVKKIYGGENCNPHCSLLNATLVRVENDSEQTLTMHLDEYFYMEVANYNVIPGVEIYDENSSTSTLRISNATKFHIRDTSNKKIKFYKNGFYDQLYNGINCMNGACDFSQAEIVTPTINTSLVYNIDLVENPESVLSISGYITDPDPLFVGLNIQLFNSLSDSIPLMTINQTSGSYTFTNIPPGSYYIKIKKSIYDIGASTWYGNIGCEENCENLSIPIIQLTTNTPLTGIDITVATKGTLSGEGILNTNQLAVTGSIGFYNSNDELVKSFQVSTSDNGVMPPVYLPQDSYRLVLRHFTSYYYSPHNVIAYPSTNCEDLSEIDCLQFSDVIEITNGNNSYFSYFQALGLGEGQQISSMGVISDSLSGDIVENAIIKFYKESDDAIYEATTDENGEFRKILSNGQYYLFASGTENNNKYISQLYNSVECLRGVGLDCVLSQGQLIEINNVSITTVNFNLTPKPKLQITSFNEYSNEMIGSSVKIFDEFNTQIDISDHLYVNKRHLIENLFAGRNYYILSKSYDYGVKGYPNINCSNFNSINSCDGQLMPISLSQASGIREIDMNLLLLGGINGYVEDGTTGDKIGNIIVDIMSEDGNSKASMITNFEGRFSIHSPNINNNLYYVSTDTGNQYINEVYKDIQCEFPAYLGLCDMTGGELLPWTENNTTPIIINIKLNVDPVFMNSFE